MYEYENGADASSTQSSGAEYNGPKRVTKIVETVYDRSGRVVSETETVESEYFEEEKTAPKFDFDLGKDTPKSPFPGGGFILGGGVDDGILNVAANTDWAAVAKKVADDIKNRYNLS